MRWMVLVLLAGCGGTTALPEPNEYVGCASDENWRTFDNEELAGAVAASAQLGPIVTAPTGTVPSTTRPTVAWERGMNDPGLPLGDVPHVNGPGCNDCCPQWTMGGLTVMHLPPISGDVYDLQFSVGGAIVWRVITTLQEWAPPTAPTDPWPSWRGQTVAVKVIRMDVGANDPMVLSGTTKLAVSPTPYSFTVGN